MTCEGILFVTRKWPPATGGMETYSHKLVEGLRALESVDVIPLAGRSNGMPPTIPSLLMFPLIVLVRLAKRRTAPRVLHLGDMALWPIGLAAWAWRCTAVVLSAHGTDVAYHRRRGLRGRMYGTYLRLGARLLRHARTIANSEATRAAAEESGWRNVVVVPLATDLSAPEPDGSHDGGLLFAGRLVERKGCGWFVREVLPLLPAGTRLKVAGTAWCETEAAVLDHPQVEFLGALPQDELARAYARAMCVIVPNIELANGEFEGFGLVACEAAACGGVVVAARTGGLASAVIDGETGFLVESGNADAWARKIIEVGCWTVDERKRFVAAARGRAVERFDWGRVATETVAAYAFPELAAGHG